MGLLPDVQILATRAETRFDASVLFFIDAGIVGPGKAQFGQLPVEFEVAHPTVKRHSP